MILSTLRVPYYLVADKQLDDDIVGSLAKSIIETRRDLLAEYPLLSQISAPASEKDTYIPIHPGAAAYYNGETKTFFDKYGEHFFIGSMLLGTITSLFAALWGFLTKDEKRLETRPLNQLYALLDQVSMASSDAELDEIERNIDDILRNELKKRADDENEPRETAAFSLVTHRLEQAISRRRKMQDAKLTLIRSPRDSTA